MALSFGSHLAPTQSSNLYIKPIAVKSKPVESAINEQPQCAGPAILPRSKPLVTSSILNAKNHNSNPSKSKGFQTYNDYKKMKEDGINTIPGEQEC